MRTLLARILPPLAPLVLVTTVLEGVSRGGLVPKFLLPPPSEILTSAWTDRAELLQGFVDTGINAGAGFALAVVFGALVAMLLATFGWARRALYPYAVFFQTVPVVSVAPLLVVWFGFGRPTVVASALLVAVFPIIASTLVGLRSTDRGLVELFRVLAARERDLLWKLRLPAALPYFFGGLRIGAGLAVIGAIVGEFIAGGGLGGIVDVARTQQRVDKVFAAVALSSLLGLILVGAVSLISNAALRPWHASARPD
jgi:NitT/TauT family transport system permease protein